MAKKNDNTLLWIGGIAVVGYLYYQYQKTAPVATGVSTTPNANGTLALLPAANTSNNVPNSPAQPVAVNTTNLVPVPVVNNTPVLQPGQGLAVNTNGSPVIDQNGNPMAFAHVAPVYSSMPCGNEMGCSEIL
jgi:hypothetical protein